MERMGDKFLARSRGSNNQNRDIGRSDPADRLCNDLHLGRPTDDPEFRKHFFGGENLLYLLVNPFRAELKLQMSVNERLIRLAACRLPYDSPDLRETVISPHADGNRILEVGAGVIDQHKIDNLFTGNTVKLGDFVNHSAYRLPVHRTGDVGTAVE